MTDEVSVVIGKTPYTTTIEYGKNTLIADEPEDLGGQDKGVAPPALLLSSLGSCKAITMKMYADRKKWALEEIKIRLSYESVKTEQQMTTFIRCHIQIFGDLDEAQRNDLYKISEKCPIQSILNNTIVIESNYLDINH